jgi:hydrogenase maturation protease
MLQPPSPNPVLIFTWGNPSRGDDALGPAMYELLLQEDFNGTDLLTDFQLQIEHCIDLEGRKRVLFVDASTSAKAPFELVRLQPEQDTSYTTHAMSPQALLSVYQQVNGCMPPPAWLLSIRGYEFGLGLPISPAAQQHLLEAFNHVKVFIDPARPAEWTEYTEKQGGIS